MLHLRQLVLVITSCLSLATVSCSHDPSRSSGDGAAARTLNAPESAALSAPPPGPWRLAPASELSHVVLWLSHVLIRHDRAPYSSVSFQLSDWHWPGPLPTRSRADALQLALQLREPPPARQSALESWLESSRRTPPRVRALASSVVSAPTS